MKVSEIFGDTIQGEGLTTGQPSVFVRLYGCNLACEHCDTLYAVKGGQYEELSVEQILERTRQFPACSNLVITGGEPLARKEKELHDLLLALQYDFEITVETNGTIFHESLALWVDLWSISPKLKCMGGKVRYDKKVIERIIDTAGIDGTQLKFVVDNEEDIVEAKNLVESLKAFPKEKYGSVPIILQPMNRVGINTTEGLLTKLRDLVGAVSKDEFWVSYDVRVLPQLHVLLWGNKQGK